MTSRFLLGWVLAGATCCLAQIAEPNEEKRDLNAENAVAAKFLRLRQAAKLPLYPRLNGVNFAAVACQAAHDNKSGEQRFENSTAIAFIYSANDPESSDTPNYMATRPWKHVRNMAVGVCHAKTKAFPEGRYWVAIGLLGSKWDKLLAEMQGSKPSD